MSDNPYQSRANNLYSILELNSKGCAVTAPMKAHEISDFIRKKYGEQPLNYFNENHALWIIDISERQVRALSIKIEI